jgi:predicted N-acetyltransferase YhbS
MDIYRTGAEKAYQLRNLFVRQSIRGQSVGRLLIRSALELLSTVNAASMMIDLARVPVGAKSAGIVDFF